MSHSTGSATTTPAVERLPDDVLSNIAQCLKGTDAVNFGRVCKAWVAPAEPAIWRDIEIKPECYVPGVTNRRLSDRAIREEAAWEGKEDAALVFEPRWYSEQIKRIGKSYKAILTSLRERPQRTGMVKNLAVYHEAGQIGADLVAAVRQTVQSLSILRIQHPDIYDCEEFALRAFHIESARPSMIGLLDSSVTFDACVYLRLQLDHQLAKGDSATILRLIRPFGSLHLEINGDPSFPFSETCDSLDSVKQLKLTCSMAEIPYALPIAATEILSRCSNVSHIEIWHPDEDFIEYVAEWYFDTEHEYDDDNFTNAISGLKHLKSLIWHEDANIVFPPIPAEESQFQALEHLTFRLTPHSWRSLTSETNYEEFVPGLTNLRSLSFVAHWPERDQRSQIIDTSDSFGLLPQAAIDFCERAPQLEFIQVTLDMLHSFAVSTSPVEVLVVNDFRQAGTDGSRLLLTRRFVFDSSNGKDSYNIDVAQDLALEADVASVFQGKAVPLPVIRRMAKLDGLHSFKGRDVEVSARAWAELEKFIASLAAAEEA